MESKFFRKTNLSGYYTQAQINTLLLNYGLKSGSLTQFSTRSHLDLSDIGTLTHAVIDGYLNQSVKNNVTPTFIGLTLSDNIKSTATGYNKFGDTDITTPVPTALTDIFVTTKASALTGAQRGFLAKAEYTGSATGGSQLGLNAFAQNRSTGTIGLCVGGRYGGRNFAAGTITQMNAVDTLIQNLSTGTITLANCFFATNPTNPAGGTINTVNAFYDSGMTTGVVNWGYYGLSAQNYMAGTLDASGYKVGGVAGISATITTAKLTAIGANGSMTFVNGILTAQTQAT